MEKVKITNYYTDPNFIKNEEYDKMENNRNKKLVLSVYDPGRFLEKPNATIRMPEDATGSRTKPPRDFPYSFQLTRSSFLARIFLQLFLLINS
jgi:hypothetical protein